MQIDVSTQLVINEPKMYTFKWDDKTDKVLAHTWSEAKRKFFKRHGFFPGPFMSHISEE